MSKDDPARARQIRESIARDIASAAEMADRLGRDDVVAILREAEDAARRGAGTRPDTDRRAVLH